MSFLFRRTHHLQIEIDLMLDNIHEGALVFEEGIKEFLRRQYDRFEGRLHSIMELEGKVDDQRRQIEAELYRHSLIPDHSGDVLSLLEALDDVIDEFKSSMIDFSIECPDIPPELTDSYEELTCIVTKSAAALLKSSRAYFRDVGEVQDSIREVKFLEKEADKLEDYLRRKIFNLDIGLDEKMHLRDFVKRIADISDVAEAVAERLIIFSLKRSV